MLLDAMWERIAERLSGQVVSLERLGPAHVEGLRLAGADPAIWRWMVVDNVDDWVEYSLVEPDRVAYATLVDGVPLGSTSYLALAPEHRRLEIGATWFAPSAWRTGANVEAKLLMLRYAFEDLGCLRVEFKTDALNERTRRSLEALPAQFEGVHRRHMLVRGAERRDSAWYSVIADEWPQVRANLERRLRAHIGDGFVKGSDPDQSVAAPRGHDALRFSGPVSITELERKV